TISFFLSSSPHPRALHSFPTRRSSDLGIGIVQWSTGPLTNYYTIDTASAPAAGPFLTGVVFSDTDGNGKYGIGEGLGGVTITVRSEEHTSELQSPYDLVCRLLLEKKKK